LALFERKLKRRKKEINNEIYKMFKIKKKKTKKKSKKNLIKKTNIIQEVIEEVSENSEKDTSSFDAKQKESTKENKYLLDKKSKESSKADKKNSTNNLEKEKKHLKIKKYFTKELDSTPTNNILSMKTNKDSISHYSTVNNNIKNKKTDINKNNINRSNLNIIDKSKRKTLLINEYISQGNLTLNNPNLFYLNLFNKLTMKDQWKRINKLYNFLKKNFK
jgi:hypothetical protein